MTLQLFAIGSRWLCGIEDDKTKDEDGRTDQPMKALKGKKIVFWKIGHLEERGFLHCAGLLLVMVARGSIS